MLKVRLQTCFFLPGLFIFGVAAGPLGMKVARVALTRQGGSDANAPEYLEAYVARSAFLTSGFPNVGNYPNKCVQHFEHVALERVSWICVW